MGENHSVAGFQSVEDMVSSMSRSEDDQLAAMAAFLVNSRLNSSQQAHDWPSFARGYNGPNYVINRYDVRLNGEFQKFSAGSLPDLYVRAAQLYLIYLGFHPGPVDGVAGVQTMAAFAEFTGEDLQDGANLDSNAVATLAAALPVTS